jgi:hypothetical protein
MELLPNDRRTYGGPGRTSAGVDLDAPRLNPYLIGRDLLLEGWRRAPILGAILPTMPWAGDAAVEYFAFAQWAPLMGAHIRHRADAVSIPEYSNAFAAGYANNARAADRNLRRRSSV